MISFWLDTLFKWTISLQPWLFATEWNLKQLALYWMFLFIIKVFDRLASSNVYLITLNNNCDFLFKLIFKATLLELGQKRRQRSIVLWLFNMHWVWWLIKFFTRMFFYWRLKIQYSLRFSQILFFFAFLWFKDDWQRLLQARYHGRLNFLRTIDG